MTTAELNIAIIGAGKISASLTPALKDAGFKIEIVVSKNLLSAKTLALKNNIKKFSDRLSDIGSGVNFFIIAVPDDAIHEAASELSRLKLRFNKSFFVHLSGSRSSEELGPVKKRKGRTASLHIMATFPSRHRKKIAGSYAAIETENKNAEKLLYRLTEDIGLIPFSVSGENKTAYHMAGVFASNFFTGQIFQAEKFLSDALNDKENALKILLPIISSTLNNFRAHGTAGALSGPVERGDIKTVKNHIASLRKKRPPALLLNYAVQSLLLLDAAEKKNGRHSKAQMEIKKLLKSEINKIRL